MDTSFEPLLNVKNENELKDVLYEEEINSLLSLASKGVMWARRKLVGELGADTFDNLPEYDSGGERGSRYED